MARKNSQFHISWMTISYRSVFLAVVLVLAAAGFVTYSVFPNSSVVRFAAGLGQRLLDKVSGNTKPKIAPGPQEAHFTAIDGTVKIKKANSNTWINAAYDIPLEKGDVVQTSAEGMAKLTFVDGTSYTVKQDSLIVIEENSSNATQQTSVAVQVTSGIVDLATSTYTEGSRSSVIVAGARAAMAPESAAVVKNDPRADQHEILVKKGSGEVVRGQEHVTLRDYERVSFKSDSAQMAKTKEIGPPTLILPANMSPVYTNGKEVAFSWTPVTGSHGYRIRVSKTPYFSAPVFDSVVHMPEARVPGLKDGNYYWLVTTIDINGRSSIESERNQFSVLTKSVDAGAVALELQPFVLHGHLVEVRGRTDPSARVIVNGQEVPLIKGDGTFSYLTPPLASGDNVITVTAQTAKGAVKSQQKHVYVD